MKKIIALLLALVLLTGCAPAAPQANTRTVIDHDGVEVTLPEKVERIVVCDILPLPSVLAVFALNFNALFTEYDMSATFASSYGVTYAMVIQNMCAEEGRDGYNVNASGRRCASTVFIMIVSGVILYLVYGVGARDLGERLEARDRRRKAAERIASVFKGKKKAEVKL